MDTYTASILGGSGYTGGELLRLLLFHPNVQIKQITSEKFNGKFVSHIHPNLRKITDLKFSSINNLENVDVIFICLPHGEVAHRIDTFLNKAKKIIDLSSDFRLKSSSDYQKWYHFDHPKVNLLKSFVYGLPELHKQEIKKSDYVASGGCNATTTILSLYPLFKHNLLKSSQVIVEVKVGSSEGGRISSPASHHPERSNVLRSYMPTGHRHMAEIIQELGIFQPIDLHFSATAVDLVRGILATCHVFVNDNINEKDIWRAYRSEYSNEPFVRIIKEREGLYRYPEPKLLTGTNYFDVGFELDSDSQRLVVLGALDNLVKGSAGQAVQAFNIMNNFPETTGLLFPGLHPI
ncbi:MAG: N-acetyl-gamma-glutamyl-phosphate reductase [Candidatus Thorarchaeota archaeon]